MDQPFLLYPLPLPNSLQHLTITNSYFSSPTYHYSYQEPINQPTNQPSHILLKPSDQQTLQFSFNQSVTSFIPSCMQSTPFLPTFSSLPSFSPHPPNSLPPHQLSSSALLPETPDSEGPAGGGLGGGGLEMCGVELRGRQPPPPSVWDCLVSCHDKLGQRLARKRVSHFISVINIFLYFFCKFSFIIKCRHIMPYKFTGRARGTPV